MSLKNLKVFNLRTILTSAALVLSLVYLVQCQDVNDYNNNQFDNPAVLPLITQVVYSQISNLTAVIGQDIGGQSSFCIRDWWVIPLCLLKKKKKKCMERIENWILNLIILISFGYEKSAQFK